MIDTSRHFLPVPFIEQMVDLMSMNKLNVLHWHIVDSQSFPYVSDAYPNLRCGSSISFVKKSYMIILLINHYL